MGFIKSIFSEASHLIKYLRSDFLRYTISYAALNLNIAVFICFTIDEILFFLKHLIHLLLRHITPNKIRSAKRITSKWPNNIHYLFLINHYSICNIKNRSKSLCFILNLTWILFVFYILWDIFHRAWSIKRNTRNYIFKARRFHLL